jgi:hypothetical protein
MNLGNETCRYIKTVFFGNGVIIKLAPWNLFANYMKVTCKRVDSSECMPAEDELLFLVG